MKILVALKRVVDPNVRVAIRPGTRQIDTSGLKTCINPFDEVALEQAVLMKEAGTAQEVVIVSVGPPAAKDTLRAGLAMGADRGILVEVGDAPLDSLGAAKVLAEVVRKESPSLVLLGKQSIDADAAQCGPMLAALLGWAQASCVARLKVEDGHLIAARDVEAGMETLRMRLPAIATADLRLAEPRYATLNKVMAARRKPLETWAGDSLLPAGALSCRLSILDVEPTKVERTVTLLADARELVNRLRNEAKVLSEKMA